MLLLRNLEKIPFFGKDVLDAELLLYLTMEMEPAVVLDNRMDREREELVGEELVGEPQVEGRLHQIWHLVEFGDQNQVWFPVLKARTTFPVSMTQERMAEE